MILLFFKNYNPGTGDGNTSIKHQNCKVGAAMLAVVLDTKFKIHSEVTDSWRSLDGHEVLTTASQNLTFLIKFQSCV